MKKYWPILVIFIVNIIFFWQFILKGDLPIPTDTIVGLYHPWRDLYQKTNPQGVPFKNFLITDPVRQQYPWRYLSLKQLFSGEMPLWNPYSFAGYPLLANLQSAFFYPLNILYLFLPFNLGWSLQIFLQPLLTSLFLYLYLRELNLRKEASLLGAISFSFSGFSMAWLEWNTLLQVALWLPLVLLLEEKILSFLSKRINNKKIIFFITLLILFKSFYLLAGHLQTAFYLAIFSAIYLIVRVWQIYLSLNVEQKKKFLKSIILFILIDIIIISILISVQFIPLFQFILNSERSTNTLSWTKEGWFIPYVQLLQFLVPDFFGNPATLNYWGTWNYAEMVGYLGIFPLMVATAAMIWRRDRKTLFFGFFFFVCLVLATPTFFAKLPFILQIPIISTSQPTRLLFLIDFSLSVLAALGFDYLLRIKIKLKQIAKLIIFFLFLFSLLWLILIFGKQYLPLTWLNNFTVIKRNLTLPTVLVLVSSLLLIAFFIRRIKISTIIASLLITLTIFDLLRFGLKFNPFVKKDFLFPETKTIRFLTEKKQTDIFRIMTTDDRLFPPNFSNYYQIQDVAGYDPLFPRDYAELVAAWERNKPDISYIDFNRIISPKDYSSRIADLLNVKYVLSLSDLTSKKLVKVISEGQTSVYENKNVFKRAFLVNSYYFAENKQRAIEAFFNPGVDLSRTAIVYEPVKIDSSQLNLSVETVKITKYTENEIQIEANTSSTRLLVLTDTYYPSWKVYIDGRESKILKVDYAFRGVIIPKGRHIINFKIGLI